MNLPTSSICLFLFSLVHMALSALPQVDFDRMGNVGLAGAFAGLDLFQNTTVSFDPATATLFSRDQDGSLKRLASTNSEGNIRAGCSLDNAFYFAGSFSSINGVPASNIASYTPSSGSFASVGSNAPNGQINAIFCDSKESKIWVGGVFSSPGFSVAIYDPKAGSWSSPPFTGISGVQGKVTSITTNSSAQSLFFSGSFVTAFGSGNAALNGTSNPNIPFSTGATPFSSSLVPVPLENAQVIGSPSSSLDGFSNIENILCPAGPDGSGNSWFAQDNSSPLITVLTFSFISANGIRLGNTFQSNHGTTGFSVTTIPDNSVRRLRYVDPTTGQNLTCTDPCPLTTDPSVPYQDFLFDDVLSITGAQIKLSQFTGAGPGLHILQLLSSGAFASAIDANNTISCFAPNPSNSTHTGQWNATVANTDIPGTLQTVLVTSVPVGTPSSSGPTFTWVPYVSSSGNYDINLLIPGCLNLQDCAARTTVKVTVFPGNGLAPFITTVSQQNQNDASVLLYSGPILPSSPDFVTTITMALADGPAGNGQGGNYELVADRVALVLKSVNATATSSGNASSNASTPGLAHGFGFFEWPKSLTTSDSSFDGRRVFPNTSLTSLDSLGFALLEGLGGISSLTSSSDVINAVAHHPAGIFVGGSFSLTSGSASGSSGIVAFKNGMLAGMADGGLNGEVTSLLLNGDQLFVGGSFKDTRSGSTTGKLSGIALYDVQKNSWSALDGGLNGAVAELNQLDGQIQVVGNFTQVLSSTGLALDVAGIAVWDIKQGTWLNSGGFVSGAMTFIGNGTNSQFVAGNIAASQQFGASGMVLVKNGDDKGPAISPLAFGLSSGVSSSSPSLRRRVHQHARRSLMSHIGFPNLFKRQTTSQPSSLPAPLPASGPAVLAGVFWTNSGKEVIILGGNFTFVPPGQSTPAQGVAIYDPTSLTLKGLIGPQINGTVRTLLVDGNSLYIGGDFTIPGASVNGLALYDLSKGAWDLNGLQSLQPASGSSVVVRSISQSTFKPSTLIVAGSFSQAGSLRCQAICSFDVTSRQWNTLGDGIVGEVSSVDYAGNNQEVLIAAGLLSLTNNNPANVVQFSLENSTWTAVGSGSDIPGPITALEVNAGNASSLFAAGKSNDESFLAFFNGEKWTTLGASLGQGSTVAQLTMVPLQNTHAANGVVETDRVLMVSGSLSTSTGNASAALFDGQNLTPYIVSSTASGSAGSISALFHSFSTFSFNKRKFLATGVVILISIAVAAGIVFLLALIGILWALFSRKDDKFNKFEGAEEEDDDSTHHRPSSLLEHINAATRTTIVGGVPFTNTSGSDKEDKVLNPKDGDHDPFGPDASNYLRAETPSDAMGGLMAEEISRPAHARYSFDGTGEGELALSAGTEVEILDDRDPAWWYARDVRTGQEGVVPAAYLY